MFREDSVDDMASDLSSVLSSPDPLGLSLTNDHTSSPTKSPKKPITPRKALSESHGNAQVQHFYLTTPSPGRNPPSSPIKSSVTSQSATSPWRIKVTVEAEPEVTMPDSPSKRLTERKFTTTVPLKEAAGSSPPAAKRGRGRPRKSLDEPSKRSGTPKPKAIGKKKAAHGAKEEAPEVQPVEKVTPKKARGRPRKSIGSSPAKSDVEDLHSQKAVTDLQDIISEGTDTTTKSPGPRGAIVPRKRAAHERSSHTTPLKSPSGSAGAVHASSMTRLTNLSSDTAKGRPAKRRSLEKTEEAGESELPGAAHGHDVTNSNDDQPDLSVQQSALAIADEDMWRSMIRRDSLPPDDTAGEEANSYQSRDDVLMTGNDPTEEHQEFDSILESEGFSMVSVSSLPSAQQHSGCSTGHNFLVNQPTFGSTPAQVLANERPNTSSQLRTPSLASSTSSMPPPPIPSARARDSPRPLTKPTDGTPRLGRVVRAGVALQGVLSPGNNNSQASSSASKSDSSAPSSSAMSSKDRIDNLFEGFGAGTRRELRAGLRLGEELAKRQQTETTFKERVEDDVFLQDGEPVYPRLPTSTCAPSYSLRMPGVDQQVQYPTIQNPTIQNPQLPSPAGTSVDDEDRMSWKASSPIEEPALPTTQQPTSANDFNEPVAGKATPCEVRWERERAAVSKEIEEANIGQVIVIDSDDDNDGSAEEEDGDDGGDIWQEEANSSRSIPEPSPEVADALFQTEPPRPRRSKVPNTWRKGRQIVYSDEIEHDEHDDVVQPKKEVVEAVHRAEAVKQQIHQEATPVTMSTPVQHKSSIPAPVHAAVKSQVAFERKYQAVEKPGWKPVKGRLQTPLKKTLKDVLSQEYDDEAAQDLSDEEEETSDSDQVNVGDVLLGSITYPELGQASRDKNSAEESIIAEEDTAMIIEESEEYEASTEYDSEGPTSPSQTPPGSPPQYLYSSLYLPPPSQNTNSWLSSLTSYIPTIRAPASTPVPNAENLDPNVWNLTPFPPLYTHLPWEDNHFRILRPYFDIQFANAGTYPFNPYSPSAPLLSLAVYARGNLGWVRYLSKSDLGLVDKYMEVLRIWGVDRRPGLWGRGDGARIDELEVAKRIFEMWQDAVVTGQAEVGEGNGTGNYPGTDILFDRKRPRKPRARKREVCILP